VRLDRSVKPGIICPEWVQFPNQPDNNYISFLFNIAEKKGWPQKDNESVVETDHIHGLAYMSRGGTSERFGTTANNNLN
jgi:hypothetical protein